MKLNPKQQKFCDEYLIDMNATQAAIRAGYSKKTAKEQASRLLTNVHVKEYVSKKQEKLQNKTAITIENVVNFINEVSQEAREDGDKNNALKGADMLMKHLGAYNADKSEDKSTKVVIVESF